MRWFSHMLIAGSTTAVIAPPLGASQQRYQTHHRNLRIALKHNANSQMTIPRKSLYFRPLISGEEFRPNL